MVRIVHTPYWESLVGPMSAALVFVALSVQPTAAQETGIACPSTPGPNATQITRCRDGLTIVAESGAQVTLHGRGQSGTIDSVDLEERALLLDAPKQPGTRQFRVKTPQAIAAVRGTKWAVDAQGAKTSVLVLQGSVAVRQPRGDGRVVLGPGEGVDVEDGAAPLTVKRWAQVRVDALLARLGQ